jgi:hypothetical protein
VPTGPQGQLLPAWASPVVRTAAQDTDACLGRPLCPDCYDSAAVVWNAHAPSCGGAPSSAIRRRLDKLAKAHGTRVKLSYAKVAEFQRRGLIHFHAIFRLDGLDPVHPERPPAHPAFTAEVLAEVISRSRARLGSPPSHPAKPRGWDITWGTQSTRASSGSPATARSPTSVASYLAKYATKSTEPVGALAGRITARQRAVYATGQPPGAADRRVPPPRGHPTRGLPALRRWAHMLGYRGHFATKSRRYSTTLRVLRAARRDWVRRQQPTAKARRATGHVVTITDLQWAGRGWRTTGDALLALSAAARAREQRRIAREEMAVTS